LTAEDILRIVENKEVDYKTKQELKNLLEGCERARFTSGELPDDSLKGSLRQCKLIIDYFERHLK